MVGILQNKNELQLDRIKTMTSDSQLVEKQTNEFREQMTKVIDKLKS